LTFAEASSYEPLPAIEVPLGERLRRLRAHEIRLRLIVLAIDIRRLDDREKLIRPHLRADVG
jgi:hypothetical protein